MGSLSRHARLRAELSRAPGRLSGERHARRRATGTLQGWTIHAYGRTTAGDDTYVYTDEFSSLAAADPTRLMLADADGADGINTRPLQWDTSLDLRPRPHQPRRRAEPEALAGGTVIENADTGDGNDTIIGNDAANWLRGWRGNDWIDGGPGADTLEADPATTAIWSTTAATSSRERERGHRHGTQFDPLHAGCQCRESDVDRIRADQRHRQRTR